MKYVFVCYAAVNRSPVAVSVAREIASIKGLDIEMDSVPFDSLWNIPCANLRETMDQYDKIFVMEDYMANRLLYCGIPENKVYCLDVPDKYDVEKREGDLAKLTEILKKKLKPLI